MKSITLSEKDVARFWSKVKIGNPDECWEWQAATNRKGYGVINIKASLFLASRISWFIKNGNTHENLLVCHKCDNPPCVNPNHLFLGTIKDNAIDMSRKGRSRKGRKSLYRGTLIKSSVLKEEDVLQIKKLLQKNMTCVEISKIYNVTPEAISSIKTGKNWNWLK